MRLIDADELKEKGFADEYTGEGIVYVEDIDNAPTLTYEDLVPHGRWEKGKEKKLYCDWEMNGWYDYPELCTNCGYDAAEHGAGVGKFCPNCGAKMDREDS